MGTEASTPSKHDNKNVPKFRKPAPKSVQEQRSKRKLESPTGTPSKKLKTKGASITDEVENKAKEGTNKRKAPPEMEPSPRREHKAPCSVEVIDISEKSLETNGESTNANQIVENKEAMDLKQGAPTITATDPSDTNMVSFTTTIKSISRKKKQLPSEY